MEALELEPSNRTFSEYLKKTIEKLQALKVEAYEKLERRVVFTDLSMMGFDDDATIVPVIEMHLDAQQTAAMKAKKEEVVER